MAIIDQITLREFEYGQRAVSNEIARPREAGNDIGRNAPEVSHAPAHLELGDTPPLTSFQKTQKESNPLY